MSIKLHIWYAKHTTGTKFYHVLRFVGPQGSFALRHFGPAATFTGMSKISMGQVELDEWVSAGGTAGIKKINEKRSGGYTEEMAREEHTFGGIDELERFFGDHFNNKAKIAAREVLRKMTGWPATAAAAAPVPEEPPAEPEREHADEPKPDAWGSW
jgi:hypothetical protein